MKIKISRNIRKYLILYLALILALYLVIEMMPKVTNIFETTQILEPGELRLTFDTEGYLIKEETIAVSPEDGAITYLMEDNTPVKKKQKVIDITEDEEATPGSRKLDDLMSGLDGSDVLKEAKKTPASGIFSLSMDGSELALRPARMDRLTYEKVKNLPLHEKSLRQTHVQVGDPLYKITNDNKWYVVCWLKKSDGENFQEGQKVTLSLPEGKVTASIVSMAEEEDLQKLIFYSDMHYDGLATSRQVNMTIEGSEQSGLLVDNACLIEKDGSQGVYVRNKNGDYYFVRVHVIETDGKESVISESTYIDPQTSETVYTVSVYDEVLKQPEKQLKKEQKEAEKEKKESEKTSAD